MDFLELYLIKSDKGDKQSNIRFSERVPTKESLLAEYLFTFVQCFIQVFHSL